MMYFRDIQCSGAHVEYNWGNYDNFGGYHDICGGYHEYKG